MTTGIPGVSGFRTSESSGLETAPSYSSTIVIEELDANFATKRSVQLIGPSLPLMGVEWGFENKLITTWYPGNADEATQQNLGPREIPSTWSFDWRRTMFSRSPAVFEDEGGSTSNIIDPSVLHNVLEDIMRTGRRLRVTWSVAGTSSGANGKIVREGRAKQGKFKYTRLQDVETEIEWEWLGRGQTIQKVVPTRDDNIQSSVAQLAVANAELANIVAAVFSTNKSLKIPNVSSLTLGQLEAFAQGPLNAAKSLARQIEQKMNQLKRIGDIVNDVRNLPFAVANQFVDVARDAASIARAFNDEIGRQPAELLSLKSNVSDLTRAHKYTSGVHDSAQGFARKSTAMASSVRGRSFGNAPGQGRQNSQSHTMRNDDVKDTYLTKKGDTPNRVSMIFFGTPDHAVEILRVNRLPIYLPVFPAGKILVIPDLAGPAKQGQ